MKNQTLFLILLLTITAPAFARIGDTKAQAEQRYGKGTKSAYNILKGSETYLYSFKGWNIYHAFIKGYAVRVQYSKQTSPIQIKPDELQAIMQAESNHKWFKYTEKKSLAQHFSDHFLIGKTLATKDGTKNITKILKTMHSNTQVHIDSFIVKKHLADLAKRKEATRKKNIPTF